MRRFQDDQYYRTTDEELSVIATRGTLSQWRFRGEGPPYVKFGESRSLRRPCVERLARLTRSPAKKQLKRPKG